MVYQPDSRPTVMDDARVSFTAIRTSEEVFDEYFPPSSRHLPNVLGKEDDTAHFSDNCVWQLGEKQIMSHLEWVETVSCL